VGIVPTTRADHEVQKIRKYTYEFEIPNLLSFMAYLNIHAFVPGINDFMNGNSERGIIPMSEKIQMGNKAIDALEEYKTAKKSNDSLRAQEALSVFEANYKYFGYGYFEKNPEKIIPSVPLTFYSFHVMVILGLYFLFFFIIILIKAVRNRLERSRFWLRLALVTIPLVYLTSQVGWLLSEVGRQPWIVQDLMPTMAAISHVNAQSVMVTFWLFAALFTLLLIAEITIILRQIKSGPKNGGI
jgi:cytochrome d ubiquinol oxidase subunit I